MDYIRAEVRELRKTVDTSRHATEGLRGLVVNLSDQVMIPQFKFIPMMVSFQ